MDDPKDTGKKKQTAEELAAQEAEETAALNAGFDAAHGVKPSPEQKPAKTPKAQDTGTDGGKGKTDEDEDNEESDDDDDKTGKDDTGTDGDADDEDEEGDEVKGGSGKGKTQNEDDEPVTLTKGQLKKINANLERLEALETAIQSANPTKELDERERKIMGKIGDLNRTLTALQQGGGKRKITKEMLKRVDAEYRDLAPLLAEDLSEILDTPASAGIDKEQLMKDVEEGSKEWRESLKKELTESTATLIDERVQNGILNYLSPGWDKKIQSDEFGEFLDSLPSKERKEIEAATDPNQVVASVKRFDDWTAAQKAAKQQQQQNRKEKQDRLDKGEQPKGNAKPVQGGGKKEDEEDESAAMNAGFNKVVRR